MNHSQQQTSNNGLSQPVSAFAADIFASFDEDKFIDSPSLTLPSTGHSVPPPQAGGSSTWMTAPPDSSRSSQSKNTTTTTAAAVLTPALTTSTSNNRNNKNNDRKGMLAKQSLLAKMYQNRSARGNGSSQKASSSETAAGSKRVFRRDDTGTPPVPTATSSSSTTTPQSTMSVDSLLHNSCKLYPTNLDIVRSALFFDPEAIRRQVHLAPKHDASQQQQQQQQQPQAEPPAKKPKLANKDCVYPINIAICHDANKAVLELLAKAGPDVLVQKDGPWEASSLDIALQAECDMGILKTLLSANPQQVQVCDRKNGYPLHTAVSRPSVSLDVVKLVYKAYPEALHKPNVRGDTPVQVAEHNISCDEEIVNYLQEQAYAPCEAEALHIHDDDLETDPLKDETPN